MSYKSFFTSLNKAEKKAAIKYGLEPEKMSDADIRKYIDNYTKISKETNWNRMSMSTAQGAAALDAAYISASFDGRYIYYVPLNSDTFVRFDTQGTSFTTAGDWQQMSMSTAQGAAALDSAYVDASFDGRYIYYVPLNSDTFIRFDTQGTSFTTAADWQKMSMSTAQGAAALDNAYFGASFDGRYIYYVPLNSDTFVRFDTQGTSFTTAADWQKISMSTAQGAAALDDAYQGTSFDGRYIYYVPYNSDTFVRFDTQGTSFTTAADWQQMSMSTAQGAAALDDAYFGASFDGRYIYYVPRNSDTFVRFDTQGTSFTTAADWQKMSMSTAQGAAALDAAYFGASFDGRYIYYVPRNSDTFVRFDTQGTSFTTAADWQKMSMSTAQGAAALDNAYFGASFDGRYIYYVPRSSGTFVRVQAMNTRSKK
jgi:predicted secreted protein